MSFLDDTRSIERQRFFNGQRLFASDLQGIETFNREMRWLHNQSLHQPGIGNGFAVGGKKDDREVSVGAGYSIDDLGREIVLTTSRTIPVPPVEGDGYGNAMRFVLTVQYPDDDTLEEVEEREGLCGTRGAVRLREEPIFCWVPLNPDGSPARDQAEILRGAHLVLTEIAVRDCKLDKDISIVQRRNARPPLQPYVACGVMDPTPWTLWEPWNEGDRVLDPEILAHQMRELYQIVGGIQAEIDTTSGEFLTTPHYFARIDGPRVITIGSEERPQRVVVEGLLSITQPTPIGFTAQVFVLAFMINRPDISIAPSEFTRSMARSRNRGADLSTVPTSERATQPVVLEGFDISALWSTTMTTIDQPTETTEPADVEVAAAAGEDAGLPDMLQDWRVGWMGVEG
jgi:hypothetical protein